jgi:hypothetical protein
MFMKMLIKDLHLKHKILSAAAAAARAARGEDEKLPQVASRAKEVLSQY